jgi:glycosyltransferase involved in cell wall biosynthesis
VSTVRAAFLMEQTLGHVTHAQNLRAAAARHPELEVTWIPIPFETTGVARFVPGYRNWSVRASWRARARLARGGFDALFFHTQVTSLFSAGLMRRVPSVVSLDATPLNFDSVAEAYGHRRSRGTWLDAQKHRLNVAALSAAKALVTWSEWAASSLVREYGIPRERILVRAPGASRAYLAIGEERSRVRTDAPIRILFVGGDFRRKGGPSLLEAVRDARTHNRFELHVVTPDPIATSRDVFVHQGVRPNSAELFALFRSADVFVLPSLGECLSVALMEAAAAGLPLISTNVGALAEAAIDGRSALVVSPGDGRSLRLAIERLVDDDDLRARLGRAAHALAVAKFDADRNNGAILELIASITRPGNRRRVA